MKVLEIFNTLLNIGNIGGMKRRTVRSVFVTPHVKRIKKAVLGGVRKLNPFRRWHNFKMKVKRRFGYNSTPAKAYRHAKSHGVASAVKLFALRKLVGRK